MYFNEEEIKLINECKNSVFECNNNENHTLPPKIWRFKQIQLLEIL